MKNNRKLKPIFKHVIGATILFTTLAIAMLALVSYPKEHNTNIQEQQQEADNSIHNKEYNQPMTIKAEGSY